MLKSVQIFIAFLWIAGLVSQCDSWIPLPMVSTRRASSIQETLLYSSSATQEDIMGGVKDFEEWFTASPGTACLPSIQHAAFDSLRGLAFTSEETLQPKTPVLTVPSSLVLSAPYADPDWDVQLAQQLWNECRKGTKSDIYGYVSKGGLYGIYK